MNDTTMKYLQTANGLDDLLASVHWFVSCPFGWGKGATLTEALEVLRTDALVFAGVPADDVQVRAVLILEPKEARYMIEDCQPVDIDCGQPARAPFAYMQKRAARVDRAVWADALQALTTQQTKEDIARMFADAAGDESWLLNGAQK